jgi:hypothetical protein
MLTPRKVAPAALALVLFLAPARAADLDPYVPADSEWVLHVNVGQLGAAPAVKKYADDRLRAAARERFAELKPLADLGVDWLKDVATATAAGSGLMKYDRTLLIARGDFKADKLRQAAEGLAKKDPAAWKVLKQGDLTLYEARDKARPLPTYFAVIADGTVLVSSGKKYLTAAAATDPKKPTKEVSKQLQALVAKADAKDDVWLASVMPKDVQRLLAKSAQTAAIAEAVTAFTGRVKVGDGVRLAFNIHTKEKKAADEVAQLLDAARGFASLAVQNVDGLGPLLSDLIDACKASADGTTATLSGQLNEEQIAKALKKK